MTSGERANGESPDLYVPEVTGESYPSAIELSESMSETELQDAIQAKTDELLDIDVQIAHLQSKRQTTANERLLYGDAYRIARDKGLE